jgi:biotin-dependent carboxylase-like uncharacterized protein
MKVLEAGHAFVTDLGRFEGPALGFSVNGALDQASAKLANVLVGNAESEPLIEITASRLRVRLDRRAVIAVTGAPVELRVDGQPHPALTPLSLPAGAEIALTIIGPGMRSYLAVHGSVEVSTLLGSVAPDSMIGFGTRLIAGLDLPQLVEAPELGNPHLRVPLIHLGRSGPTVPTEPVIDVTDGPDRDEFGASAEKLFTAQFIVEPRSNHVGLRLTGVTPQRERAGEVLSRGVPVGAVEVPSDSQLLVLHRGRGVTAGYPVLAVLTTGALDLMAQVRPGQRVRFRRVSIARARDEHRRRELALAHVRERVQIALVEHGLELPGRTATDPVIAGTGIGSDEVGLHGARLTNDVSVTPDADALRG